MSDIKGVARKAMPSLWVIRRHRRKHERFPSIIWPKTFNDKVLHRILFDRRSVLTQLTDKFAVRSYVEPRLGSLILPELYHVTKDPGTIPFDSLPEKFVVKPTHASGWVEIVTDKSSVD